MRAWSDDFPPSKRPHRTDSRDHSTTPARFAGRLGPPPKRDDSDGEDNPDEDGQSGVKSSVVAAVIPPRPQTDPDEDVKSKRRNQRMFGFLMGTLQKFKTESEKNTEKEKRRAEIEEKLEQAATKEREEAAKERKELYEQRRAQRHQLAKLTSHMTTAEMYEEWNAHNRNLLGYIKTKAKPSIFYLPTKANENIDKLVAKTKEEIEATIQARQKEIETLISDTQQQDVVVKPEEEEEEEGEVAMKEEEESGQAPENEGVSGSEVKEGKQEVESAEVSSRRRRRRRSDSREVGSSEDEED